MTQKIKSVKKSFKIDEFDESKEKPLTFFFCSYKKVIFFFQQGLKEI